MAHNELLFRAMPLDTDPWFILPKGSTVHLRLEYCFTCLMRRRVKNYLIFFSDQDHQSKLRTRDVVIRTDAPIGKWQLVSKRPMQELIDRSFVRQMELFITEPNTSDSWKARRARYQKSLNRLQGLVGQLPEKIDEVYERRLLPVQASGR